MRNHTLCVSAWICISLWVLWLMRYRKLHAIRRGHNLQTNTRPLECQALPKEALCHAHGQMFRNSTFCPYDSTSNFSKVEAHDLVASALERGRYSKNLPSYSGDVSMKWTSLFQDEELHNFMPQSHLIFTHDAATSTWYMQPVAVVGAV